MACPRCGNENIRVGKVTVLGQQPGVPFVMGPDDVVVHSYYCFECGLLEESADSDEVDRLWRRWELIPELEQPVTWTETEDPFEPSSATVDGREWRLRPNDFPRQPRYTLIIDGREVASFSYWPISWKTVSR